MTHCQIDDDGNISSWFSISQRGAVDYKAVSVNTKNSVWKKIKKSKLDLKRTKICFRDLTTTLFFSYFAFFIICNQSSGFAALIMASVPPCRKLQTSSAM